MTISFAQHKLAQHKLAQNHHSNTDSTVYTMKFHTCIWRT